MSKPEKRTIYARLSEKQIEKLEQIMQEDGITNYSAGLGLAISKGYDKVFPRYIQKRPNYYRRGEVLRDSNK